MQVKTYLFIFFTFLASEEEHATTLSLTGIKQVLTNDSLFGFGGRDLFLIVKFT